MTNDTPSAKRTNAPTPIDISEAGTVERAIQIEERMEVIEGKMTYLEHRMWDAIAQGFDDSWYQNELDDLESELYDLQREYRG